MVQWQLDGTFATLSYSDFEIIQLQLIDTAAKCNI